ncbi:iron ABC transporter permease [Treponema sp.]
MASTEKFRQRALILSLVTIISTLIALALGRYPRPGFMSPFLLVSDQTAQLVIFGARLPRVLGALLVGAVLGGAGAAFQLVFANPLVEPGFLGVSQGAALGAALAMTMGARIGFAVSGPAFVGALVALAASAALARRFRFGGSVLRLVLAGIAVSSLCSAGLAIIKYTADPMGVLPDIAYWTLGGLASMTWPVLGYLAIPASVSIVALFIFRGRMDLLSLDEDVAHSLGVRPQLERGFILAFAALGVAAVTSAAGVVSWAGLVVPHVARALFGVKARISVPASMVIGAVFIVLCDAVARAAFAGELPLGATVSALSAIVFARFLSSGKTRIVR